ncbi:hypothetical protein EMEDMD4_1320005 [Sinorhizobium medicae]|uniref:Uncharacterized protein n=1 Tax=Sinorhizobium medicae TaxID=110321 RepID=A0A508WRT7_9HYPH|nr:hypothetical protein EMEDMD4_1320005 [Sinorhizobium medicae]
MEFCGDFGHRGGRCDPHNAPCYARLVRELLFLGNGRRVPQTLIGFFPPFPTPAKFDPCLGQLFGIQLRGQPIDISERVNRDNLLGPNPQLDNRSAAGLSQQLRFKLLSEARRPHALQMARVPSWPHLFDRSWTTRPLLITCFIETCAQRARRDRKKVSAVDHVRQVFERAVLKIFFTTGDCRRSSAILRISHDPSSR